MTRAIVDGCFIAIVAAGAFSDVMWRRVPNVLVVVLCLIGLLVSVSGASALPLVSAAGGILVGVAIWLPLWFGGAIGAGDVKFFGAASAWIGPTLAWRASLGTAVIGGFLASAFWFWLRRGDAAKRPVDVRSFAQPDESSVAGAAGTETLQPTMRSFPYAVPMAIMLVVARVAPQWLLSS